MNISDIIRNKQIRSRLAAFRPDPPRAIEAEIQVPSKCDRFGLLGTAFDYLLRFEIGRRVPTVTEDRWIAGLTLNGYPLAKVTANEPGRNFCQSRPDFDLDALKGQTERIVRDRKPNDRVTTVHVLTDPYEVYFYRVVNKVVEEARADIATYRANPLPSLGEVKQAAYQAIRLAKLDPINRAGHFDPTFEMAEPFDIDELTELLQIVAWNDILIGDPVILNPTLGCSDLGIRADADLIIGDCLVEIKTTEKSKIEVDWLDQLFCYFLLARYKRRAGKDIPEIRSLWIYFARHGFFWKRDVRTWTDRPQFLEFEQWFVNRFGNGGMS